MDLSRRTFLGTLAAGTFAPRMPDAYSKVAPSLVSSVTAFSVSAKVGGKMSGHMTVSQAFTEIGNQIGYGWIVGPNGGVTFLERT